MFKRLPLNQSLSANKQGPAQVPSPAYLRDETRFQNPTALSSQQEEDGYWEGRRRASREWSETPLPDMAAQLCEGFSIAIVLPSNEEGNLKTRPTSLEVLRQMKLVKKYNQS